MAGSGGGSGGGGGSAVCVGGGTGPQQGTDGGARQGYVQLQQIADVKLGVGAFYADMVPGGLLASCTTRMLGPCVVLDCPPDAGTGGVTPVSAGSIQVQVGSQTISLTQGNDGFYSGVDATPGSWWTGGDTITITGSGRAGGVPAFTATLIAPTRHGLMPPVPTTITRGADVPLLWSVQTPSYVNVLAPGSTNPLFFCVPQPGSCGMTIPGALTQQLPLGNGAIAPVYTTTSVSTSSGWAIRGFALESSLHSVVVQ